MTTRAFSSCVSAPLVAKPTAFCLVVPRANILFGIAEEDANEEFIQRSLAASTLSLDMDDPESTLHAKREETAAGQNGSELSGGQQARVALARSVQL